MRKARNALTRQYTKFFEMDGVELLVTDAALEAIDAGIKALEKRCEFYVERRMNANIRKAMAGHSVNEFEQESE